MPECVLDPLRTGDLPHAPEDSGEWWGEEYERFRARHSTPDGYRFSDVFMAFAQSNTAREATKIGGFAAWQQGADYPTCRCGRWKEFFFQLSSQDRDRGPDAEAAAEASEGYATNDYYWSDHGLMIGDLGNLYFFICPSCGTDSIEGTWDCG